MLHFILNPLSIIFYCTNSIIQLPSELNYDRVLLRMPPSVPESQLTLPQLFTELQKFVNKNDLKNIVKFSNLILHAKGGQNDVDALKCKSIALIEMEKFGECIKALQEGKVHVFYR